MTSERSVTLFSGRTFTVTDRNYEDNPSAMGLMLDCIEAPDILRAGDVDVHVSNLGGNGGIDARDAPYRTAVGDLTKYFEEQDRESIFMWLFANHDSPHTRFGYDEIPFHLVRNSGAEATFRLSFKKSFLETISNMFPSPFIQLKGIIRKSINDDPVFVDKRFNVAELRETSGNTKTMDTDSFNILNEYYGRHFVYGVILGWVLPDEPAETKIKISVGSIMEMLLANESTKDIILVAGDGSEIKCHHFILAAHSPVFTSMLCTSSGMKEAINKRIEMEAISEVGIRHLIQYLYGMELTIDDLGVDIAVELFQSAHMYELSHLEDCLRRVFLQRDMEWLTTDVVLRLYFYVKNVDLDSFQMLREHSLQLLANMDTETLQSSNGYKELKPEDSLALSFKLVKLLQQKGK